MPFDKFLLRTLNDSLEVQRLVLSKELLAGFVNLFVLLAVGLVPLVEQFVFLPESTLVHITDVTVALAALALATAALVMVLVDGAG